MCAAHCMFCHVWLYMEMAKRVAMAWKGIIQCVTGLGGASKSFTLSGPLAESTQCIYANLHGMHEPSCICAQTMHNAVQHLGLELGPAEAGSCSGRRNYCYGVTCGVLCVEVLWCLAPAAESLLV